MRQKKAVLLVIIWMYAGFLCEAQSDSSILTYNDYLDNILLFHPIAKKANLQTRLGEAARLSARGNLDPTLSGSWNEKDFDKKLYYRQYRGRLKVPTRLGIDVVGGYENTDGVFLNPEDKTDANGLWHLGVEVNLLQGLITNERKTALEQARILQNRSENERQLILNDLLYKASTIYLEWQKYHYFQNVLNENIEIANTYFRNTKLSYESGEKTAMDTLEAFILFQDASNLFQKNERSLTKARQNIENYLWYDELPVTLQTGTDPEDYTNELFQLELNATVPNLVNKHPLILSYINKQSFLEIEQKLKREKLKPKLKVKYNPLLSTSNNSIVPNFSISDYKWGFDFSMPLLFRSEKANIQKGEIKIQETRLDIESKKNELLNKIENSLQQQSILRDQIALSEQNLIGYNRLLEGENEKFRFGESSVFLLNKRQEKYINGQLKLIELNIKRQLERLNYFYYTNELIGR